MAQEKSISDLITELNDTAENIRKQPLSVKNNNIPAVLDLAIPGISNISAIKTLFSGNVDDVLSGIFKAISSGDIEKAVLAIEHIKEILNHAGIGEGYFKGPVSKTVINTIIDSTSDFKYNSIKSNISTSLTSLKKISYIIKKLEKKTDSFSDKDTKQKYKDSVYALKRALKIAIKIYKNRKIVNQRVINGLKNIVTEDVDVLSVTPIIE